MEKPIGIIGAMDIEVNAVLSACEKVGEDYRAGMRFTLAKLNGVPIVVARCFEGKVNSALCAQAMIDNYDPRLLLNIGVAGGLGRDVHIGDVVVASHCVQHDFDPTPLGSPMATLSVPGQEGHVREFPCDKELSEKLRSKAETVYDGTVHYGCIVTGDRFIADPETGRRLNSEYGALACEMEGGSIAHVCLANNVPCVVLRSISDNANDSDTVDFLTFAESSAEKVQKLLGDVITEL